MASKQPETRLNGPYTKIVVPYVTIKDSLINDYPDATGQCQEGALSGLDARRKYADVSPSFTGPGHAKGVLLVKIHITDMRIVSGAARAWAGAMAGSSYMNLDVTLVDAATNKVLRKKELSSHNNAFGAEWTGGSSDRSLPTDMGRIVADYVSSVTP